MTAGAEQLARPAVWRDSEVISSAATHPDLADLADVQLKTGRGPIVAAADAQAAPG